MRPFHSLFLHILPVLACLSSLLIAAKAENPVMKAMDEELVRSIDKLQLENLEKPYFISYRCEDNRNQRASATFGSLVALNEGRYRRLIVEVRVGSPAMDNTNFAAGFSSLMLGGDSSLCLDDNVAELRRQIWLATDRAYKSAVETLSKKRAALQNKTRTDETPDFSPQAPATLVETREGIPMDMRKAEELVREVSAVFRNCPAVSHSMVSIETQIQRSLYVNSEGSRFMRDEQIADIVIQGTAQAEDGFPMEDAYARFARSPSELPAKAELLEAARIIGGNLAALRSAPLPEQYNGPVLFEDQAASEIFSQVFAHHLCAKKRPVSDGMMGSSGENPFMDRIGARVLPGFLELVDDATLKTLAGTPLLGNLPVDDEGVPTRRVKLVENGRLKTLLVTRAPIRGVPQSTGSARGNGPGPSSLILSCTQGGMEAADLRAELLKTIKERNKDYGFIVRRIANPMLRLDRLMLSTGSRDSVRVEPAVLAYKVYPDGREELVRNVEIAGMNASSFKDIIAAGREPRVHSMPFRSSFGGGDTGIVSFAVPSLLFEDVTLKKPGGEVPKPQVAKHPSFAKD